jgi:hypothetical protein
VPREAEVMDGLIELLIQVTHRITARPNAASSMN